MSKKNVHSTANKFTFNNHAGIYIINFFYIVYCFVQIGLSPGFAVIYVPAPPSEPKYTECKFPLKAELLRLVTVKKPNVTFVNLVQFENAP